MKKSMSLLIVGILATDLYSVPINIGIKAPKSINLESKIFKNINKSEGLTEFDSKLYTQELPKVENDMECNSEEAKQFVSNYLLKSSFYDNPSYIGGHKVVRKSEKATYCSVSYKNGNMIEKANYWIVNVNGQAHPYMYESKPVECDDVEVQEYFKAIAKARKITIEELGGFDGGVIYHKNDRSKCTVAYKTSDMSDLEVLTYVLSRDEDFNVVLKTSNDENENMN